MCSKILEEADSLEDRLAEEIHSAFSTVEESVSGLICILNNVQEEGGGSELPALLKQAQEELSAEPRYDVYRVDSAGSFPESYKLGVALQPAAREVDFGTAPDKVGATASLLQEHLERAHESMIAALDRVREVCSERREKAEKLRGYITKKLEPPFKQEDARVQQVVKALRERIAGGSTGGLEEEEELRTKAAMVLVGNQKYAYTRESKLVNGHTCDIHDVLVTKEASLGCLGFEEKRPEGVSVTFTKRGKAVLSFSLFGEDEVQLLRPLKMPLTIVVRLWRRRYDNAQIEHTAKYRVGSKGPTPLDVVLSPGTAYCMRMRAEHSGSCTQWSDEAEFATFCVWRECPVTAERSQAYTVGERSPRVATKAKEGGFSTITGNVSLPLERVVSWNVRLLRTKGNGSHVFVGVAPSDIDRGSDESNAPKCGWYLDCTNSSLVSGPPHNYAWKEYEPKKGKGKYVHTESDVGVVMDTARGELSFALDGVNHGAAYEGIPLDRPLVPCVILGYEGDSIELCVPEVKEAIADISILAPSNIAARSITWESVTLTWDAVEGASFYQVEVNGSAFWDTPAGTVTRRGLLPDTVYALRVRSVKEGKVGNWSGAVRWRTPKAGFESGWWKDCPKKVYSKLRYTVVEDNPKAVVKSRGDDWCTVIWNTTLPPSKATSWSIKVLGTYNTRSGIIVGVAPHDIDQGNPKNFRECGWYFYCYESSLTSGPPHNYAWKEYGPRREGGDYVHAGDSVGVTIDTAKGELSFAVNGVNLGVAYEGILLDKPLVPCVIIWREGDSVEFVP